MHIGDCLNNKGVYQGQSVDHLHRQRFHSLSYNDHYHGKFPQWFKDFSQDRQLKVYFIQELFFYFEKNFRFLFF